MTGRGSIPLEDPPVCLERFREDRDYEKQHDVRSWGQTKFEDSAVFAYHSRNQGEPFHAEENCLHGIG